MRTMFLVHQLRLMSIFVVSFFFCSVFLVAEPSGQNFTLQTLIDSALKSSQSLKSQDARIEASRFDRSQALSWPGSQVEAIVGRKTESGISGPRSEFGLSQPIPVSGRLGLRGKLIELQTTSLALQRSSAEISVMHDVLEAASRYALAQKKAEFVASRQQRFKLIHNYLAGRVFATPQRKAERSIVQNRVSVLTSEQIETEATIRSAEADLSAFVPMRDVQPKIDLPWLNGTKELEPKPLSEKARSNSLALRSQQIAIDAANVEKNLLLKERFSDPSLVASYERAKSDVTEENVGVGVSLGFATWNGNRAALASSKKRIAGEEQLQEFNKARVNADIAKALSEYESARRIAAAFPASLLNDLDVQLSDVEQGFKKGQIDLLTFLELDNSAAESYMHVLNAQQNLFDKIGDLITLTQDASLVAQINNF